MSRIYQTSKPVNTSPPVNTSSQQNQAASSVVSSNHSKSPSPASVKNDANDNTIDIKQFDRMEKLVNRLESIASRLENASVSSNHQPASLKSTTNAVVEISSPSVDAFNYLLDSNLKQFIENSNQIGGDVKLIGEMVKNLFELEKLFLSQAAASAKPSDDNLMKALEPLSKIINEIQTFREKNRKSEFFNHLSAVSESIGALGWIAVQPAPCPYIKEMNDAGQFYTNRVLKDFKEKDPQKLHSNWVQSWIKLLNELQAYVKEHHTTGVTWNPKGGVLDLNKISVSAKSSAPVSSGGAAPPPPPPPPPMPTFDLLADPPSSGSNSQDLHAQLAKELNIGTDITKGLRKVTDDQKTHKNPALRAGNTVPGGVNKSEKNSSQTPATSTSAVVRPPKFELVDKKWVIEFQNKQNNLVVDNTELKQTVYIYKCKETTVQVKGKVNSILVDSCERVGVLFDDVLSTIEFINSKNVQAQVNGKVPTISIDKTDGCQMYLSKQSLEAEIVSSKSSAMNILIPGSIDGDYIELALPEQYKTTINSNKKLITVPTESA